jgi:NTE family protein
MNEDLKPQVLHQVVSPVQAGPDEAKALQAPEKGLALCLSGGGYRAMLFHVGAVMRLNELGYLPKLDRVSSVSGGSITAGALGLNWKRLAFDASGVATNLTEVFVQPIRRLAGKTIDASAIVGGVLLPGTVANRIQAAYRDYLFGSATLQDLPDRPRFVINATNVQSLVLWRFSKPYMRDYRVGEVKNPNIELAVAVSASSAFPPVLSPVELKLHSSDFTPGSGQDLQQEPYTTDVVLTDGGVYDNLGLETAWKRYDTILVSDGGGLTAPEPEPKHDWGRHAFRILNIIDNQVRSLRKRQVVGSFVAGIRKGAYWGIRTNIADYQLADALACPYEQSQKIAGTATRLKRLEDDDQERLIDWGYAVSDAAMRRHVQPAAAPVRSPYGHFAAAQSRGISA